MSPLTEKTSRWYKMLAVSDVSSNTAVLLMTAYTEDAFPFLQFSALCHSPIESFIADALSNAAVLEVDATYLENLNTFA